MIANSFHETVLKSYKNVHPRTTNTERQSHYNESANKSKNQNKSEQSHCLCQLHLFFYMYLSFAVVMGILRFNDGFTTY
jgi:hypothetical protein